MICIRPETPSDDEAIEQITIAAFSGKPYSAQTEHLVIRRLREAKAMSLSLVAEIGETIVGHVAFSVVKINGEDKQWYGLGPVSVLPASQKQGIGSSSDPRRIDENTRFRRKRLCVGRQSQLLPTIWF